MSDKSSGITLDSGEIRIPFRTAFSHASASREQTAAVWVRARAADGFSGFGEGCPRDYVTGETVSQALVYIRNLAPNMLDAVNTLSTLTSWTVGHKEDIDQNPAAWCAVELAMLDLFSRRERKSAEAFLGLPELRQSFQYSAVLGDSGMDTFVGQAKLYLEAGFRDFKIKLSGNLERDREKMHWLEDSAPKEIRVRGDANNLWQTAPEAVAYIEALGFQWFALEEPIAAGDYHGCEEITSATGIPIILDESLLRVEQLERLAENPENWLLNLRVSKLGGLLRSLEIVKIARELNLGIIVGAQVGETSLLTRAGLTLAAAAGDLLIAQEGAFGTWLLKEDICDPPLMFGKDGLLAPTQLTGIPGFGLTVIMERL